MNMLRQVRGSPKFQTGTRKITRKKSRKTFRSTTFFNLPAWTFTLRPIRCKLKKYIQKTSFNTLAVLRGLCNHAACPYGVDRARETKHLYNKQNTTHTRWINTVLSETPPHKPHTGGKPHQDCHRLHHSQLDRHYRYHQSLGRIINISDCSRRSSSIPPSTRHTK